MTKSKQSYSLNREELSRAIQDYIEKYASPKVCPTDRVTVDSSGSSATCEVEPLILSAPPSNDSKMSVKLRHRESRLCVESIFRIKNEVKLQLGLVGREWPTIEAVFQEISKLAAERKQPTNYGGFIQAIAPEYIKISLDDFKEELLAAYEVVYLGEVKSEDMTFHLDALKKMS